MIEWNWKKAQVAAGDVLDAARAIAPNSTRITTDTTSHWAEASLYTGWATAALLRGGDGAWDAAAGWAKRAVCRRMDGILARNHLGGFLGQNYGKKAEYLAELGVPGLALLRGMIIDPRNDIEHAYSLATEEQARGACELADLFLRATEADASAPAIAALGWNADYSLEICTRPGGEYQREHFSLDHYHSPMLLVDEYREVAEVLVLYPKDEEVSLCPRDQFRSDQLIELNSRLRQCLNSEGYSSIHLGGVSMVELRSQLRL